MKLNRIIGASVASKSFSTNFSNLRASRKIYVGGFNKGSFEVQVEVQVEVHRGRWGRIALN